MWMDIVNQLEVAGYSGCLVDASGYTIKVAGYSFWLAVKLIIEILLMVRDLQWRSVDGCGVSQLNHYQID